MQKHIEDAIIAGTAVALHTHQVDLIQAAFGKELTVYAPVEPGRCKFDWFDKAAGIANMHKIAELREALSK